MHFFTSHCLWAEGNKMWKPETLQIQHFETDQNGNGNRQKNIQLSIRLGNKLRLDILRNVNKTEYFQ